MATNESLPASSSYCLFADGHDWLLLFTLVDLDDTVDNLGPFFCAPQTVVAINNQRFVYGFITFMAHRQSLVRQNVCYGAERTFDRRV